jgi:hypothetical protein
MRCVKMHLRPLQQIVWVYCVVTFPHRAGARMTTHLHAHTHNSLFKVMKRLYRSVS